MTCHRLAASLALLNSVRRYPRLLRFKCLFIGMVLIAPCHWINTARAQVDTSVSPAGWNVLPGAIRQGANGKYPPTATLVLFLHSCERESGKWKLGTSKFSVIASGSGIALSQPVVGDCRLTTTATIDQAVQPDLYNLMVTSQDPDDANKQVDQGYAKLTMFGPLAGPTPSTPEVDVQWKVLSHHACADTFGNHVAGLFYCAQVTIGNNSAYKLQIASIGFRTPDLFADSDGSNPDTVPNTSYQTTRAVAQTGQTTTFRNLLYNGIGATGLLMASFTPYFHNSHNVARWSTGAAIVSGAFTSAIGLVAPDLTLRELNNLDDQSLRDGKIINNNTQAPPFDIFIDQRDAVPLLNALFTKYKAKWTTPDAGQEETLGLMKKCVQHHGKDCDPAIVKKAIGSLVLVGSKIDYLERIVVDSSVTSQEVQVPSVSNVDQLSVIADGTQQTLELKGTNLSGLTEATSTDAGVKIGSIKVNADGTASIPVTVDSKFRGNSFNLLLNSPKGNVTLKISVKPYISNGESLSIPADGNQHALDLQGTNLDLITGASVDPPDPKIQVGTLSNRSETTLSIPLTVESGFAADSITLNLSSPSGAVPIKVAVKAADAKPADHPKG